MEYSKVEIYGLVDYIRGKLHDDKYQNLNLSNNVEQYHLGNRIGVALNRLKKYQDSFVPCNDKYDPRNLLKHWRLFDKEFNGTFTMETKRSYGDLIKETLCFLEYIISLPKVVAKKLESPAKTTDAKEMEERLTKVARSRDKVKEQLSKLSDGDSKNDAEVVELKLQLEKLNEEYKSLSDKKNKVSSDKLAEANISDSINIAFENLKGYTKDIEDERFRAKIEYYVFLGGIAVLVLIFIVLYFIFIHDIATNRKAFEGLVDYLPYTAAVPFLVALIWLCVYLKDRASKISIELSTRLFNIHYLEGLMKLTNSLSVSPEESIRRLDNATNSLMQNYLSQIEHNHITEKEVAKIELSELKSNPYWKILQEIKNLVKLIKQ